VKAWKAKYPDRPITCYAAQGYDAALMIGVGLEKSPDRVNNAAAFRKALLTSDIPTVRGKISLWPEPTSGSGLVRGDRCEGTGWQDGPENGKESFYRSWRHLRRRMQDEGA